MPGVRRPVYVCGDKLYDDLCSFSLLVHFEWLTNVSFIFWIKLQFAVFQASVGESLISILLTLVKYSVIFEVE